MGKIILPCQPGWVEEAHERAEQLVGLRNSITGGRNAWVGVLGQIAYADFQGSKECETYHFDVKVGLRRDEVKTKLRGVPAEGNHNATVAAANCTQDCDRYVFASLYPDRGELFIVELMGWMTPLAFFQAAELRRKGEDDPEGLGWTFKADCYNLPYAMLLPVVRERHATGPLRSG
jgi:hypothetical protein